jgi:hypothetical protein
MTLLVVLLLLQYGACAGFSVKEGKISALVQGPFGKCAEYHKKYGKYGESMDQNE